MPDAGTQADALGVYLTGGASNSDPDASLGGTVSSTLMRGLGSLHTTPIPAVRVDHVFAANGEGSAQLRVDSSGDLLYTPPGGTEGSAVTIAAGETKLVPGGNSAKAVLVTRETGWDYSAGSVMTMDLVHAVNGVVAQGNLTSAERAAGKTTYRAVMLHAHGSGDVKSVLVWFPAVAGAQATYSVGTEAAGSSGDSIQSIADEETAPSGISWSTPTTEGTALNVGDISSGTRIGLWIRRVFPAAGSVKAREEVQMTVKYEGLV